MASRFKYNLLIVITLIWVYIYVLIWEGDCLHILKFMQCRMHPHKANTHRHTDSLLGAIKNNVEWFADGIVWNENGVSSVRASAFRNAAIPTVKSSLWWKFNLISRSSNKLKLIIESKFRANKYLWRGSSLLYTWHHLFR